MDQRLIRIRELIDQKEGVDAELATLIGGLVEQPKRGRPKKAETPEGERQPSPAATAAEDM